MPCNDKGVKYRDIIKPDLKPMANHPTKKPSRSIRHQTLDPRMLGRPTHLLDGFGATLRQYLDQFFTTSLGRRHGVAVAVRNVSFASHVPELEARPWRRETVDRAAIGVHIERALLLLLLELRYGPAISPVMPPPLRPMPATRRRQATAKPPPPHRRQPKRRRRTRRRFRKPPPNAGWPSASRRNSPARSLARFLSTRPPASRRRRRAAPICSRSARSKALRPGQSAKYASRSIQSGSSVCSTT